MKTDIEKPFVAIGARVEVTPLTARDRRIGRQWMTRTMASTPMLVDVKRDGRDERFTVTHHSDSDVRVISVNASCQHLVLTMKPKDHPARRTFLCGRDESHWFVAAIPERANVRTVQDAMDALKPPEVWASIRMHDVPESQWNARRTAAFVRQGEWFFIPRPEEDGRARRVLHREPLSRGLGSQPHRCEEVFRLGGQDVWVSDRFPRGLSDQQFRKLPERSRKSLFWQRMRRGARAFARGWVRHRDHATVTLDGWHEIVMNTESQATAMREQVVFLD